MNYALKYARFWFWYFCVAVAIMAMAYASAAVGAIDGKASTGGIFRLAVSTLALWPLYGYVRQKRIAPRWLWRLVFIFLGVSLLLASLFAVLASLKTGLPWALLATIVILLVASPQVFALYQYVHRSPHIWSASEA